jgi:integrase
VAATTRRTHAAALTAVTALMLTTERGGPDPKVMRAALCRWAFNTARRDDPEASGAIRAVLEWVKRHTLPVSALTRPDVLRRVLDGLTVRLDDQPAAASVVSRRRKILNTAIEYAVERQVLAVNPLPALKWKPPRRVQLVDRRVVANPAQVRTLLAAVGEQARSEPRLVAFFGCLYFAGLRPEEAVGLSRRNLALPAEGWGELHPDGAEPYAGKDWTDTGEDRDRRQLKQRARGETRSVPCPPELTALLHAHIERFGTASAGRLFVGERNGSQLPKPTIVRVLEAGPRGDLHGRGPGVAAGPDTVRPEACGGVDVAQRRGAGDDRG